MMKKNVQNTRKAMVKAAGKCTVLHASYRAVLRSRATQRYWSKKAVKPI